MTPLERPAGRAALSVLLTSAAAAGVALAVRALDQGPGLPGGSERWRRTNHAGDVVTLAEGVALTAGTAVPLLASDRAAALVVLGAGAAGALDDLAGDADAKGLRGHLTALRHGRVTTGSAKILLLGASGLLGALLSDRQARQNHALPGHGPGRAGRGQGARTPQTSILSTLLGGALVAGSANLANLFDLRPGRALKVALVPALPLTAAGRPAAGAALGAGLAVLPDDLRGRSMLGDTGANPLGAAVGLAAVQALGLRGRAVALAAVAGLVLLSERVSFSRVIESTPALRAIDRWGREDPG